MSGWLWRWGPPLAVMAAIFVTSSIPDLGPLPANTSDKVAHFVAYSGLGALLARAFAGARWAGYTGTTSMRAWAATAAYGITDEMHQMVVPGRTPSVGDIVADAAGAALGVWLALVVAGMLRNRQAGIKP